MDTRTTASASTMSTALNLMLAVAIWLQISTQGMTLNSALLLVPGGIFSLFSCSYPSGSSWFVKSALSLVRIDALLVFLAHFVDMIEGIYLIIFQSVDIYKALGRIHHFVDDACFTTVVDINKALDCIRHFVNVTCFTIVVDIYEAIGRIHHFIDVTCFMIVVAFVTWLYMKQALYPVAGTQPPRPNSSVVEAPTSPRLPTGEVASTTTSPEPQEQPVTPILLPVHAVVSNNRPPPPPVAVPQVAKQLNSLRAELSGTDAPPSPAISTTDGGEEEVDKAPEPTFSLQNVVEAPPSPVMPAIDASDEKMESNDDMSSLSKDDMDAVEDVPSVQQAQLPVLAAGVSRNAEVESVEDAPSTQQAQLPVLAAGDVGDVEMGSDEDMPSSFEGDMDTSWDPPSSQQVQLPVLQSGGSGDNGFGTASQSYDFAFEPTAPMDIDERAPQAESADHAMLDASPVQALRQPLPAATVSAPPPFSPFSAVAPSPAPLTARPSVNPVAPSPDYTRDTNAYTMVGTNASSTGWAPIRPPGPPPDNVNQSGKTQVPVFQQRSLARYSTAPPPYLGASQPTAPLPRPAPPTDVPAQPATAPLPLSAAPPASVLVQPRAAPLHLLNPGYPTATLNEDLMGGSLDRLTQTEKWGNMPTAEFRSWVMSPGGKQKNFHKFLDAIHDYSEFFKHGASVRDMALLDPQMLRMLQVTYDTMYQNVNMLMHMAPAQSNRLNKAAREIDSVVTAIKGIRRTQAERGLSAPGAAELDANAESDEDEFEDNSLASELIELRERSGRNRRGMNADAEDV